MEKILPFAKSLLQKAVKSGDVVIDATLGNGHDTAFLAELVGSNGQVFGFDVQQEAIEATNQRLRELDFSWVTLFHSGHENIINKIPANTHGRVKGAIFNLGYLPGSDKTIVTRPETTISAIQQLLEVLAPEGIIVVVIYHGHEEGQIERDSVLEFCRDLDQKTAHVLQYQFINQQNHPPFIIAIEKR